MSMVIMVLLFGGFFRISCSSFPHPRSEKCIIYFIFFLSFTAIYLQIKTSKFTFKHRNKEKKRKGIVKC